MADEPVRESRRDERRSERIQQARGTVVTQRVRVLPRDEGLRKLLKHPSSGGFPSVGSVEWPHDQFTKRRLRDGDITIEQIEPEAHRDQRMKETEPKEARAVKPTSEPPRS